MQNAVIRCIAVTCFYLFSFTVAAQQQMGPYIAYGFETKYFSNLNYSAFQSTNGYLWFGTSSGIVRFDGKRYKNYFADYTDPNSPSDNVIFDITEDKDHDIWLAGFNHGATKYNQTTGRFKKYPALSKDNNPYYGIYRIVNDSKGNLWFATAGRGMARYDFTKDSFDLFYPHPGKPTDGTARGYNYVTDIVEDKTDKNLLWVSTFYGLFSFDKTTEKFTYYFSGSTSNDNPDILINDMEPDNNGLLWLGTYNDGLRCFDTKTKKILPQKTNRFANVVYDLKFVNDSILYAACLNDGLYQLNISTGIASNITPQRNPGDATAQLPGIQKVSITPDAGIFIGGNAYVYQRHPDFVRLRKNIFSPFPNNVIGELNAVVWDKLRQLYWITTAYHGNGIYTLDKDLQQFRLIAFPGQKSSSEGHSFKDIVIDALNRVWMLSEKNEIYQWSDKEQMFAQAAPAVPLPDSLIKKIWKLTSTPDGNIWMMCGSDFIYWDIKENKTERYPLNWNDAYKGLHNIAISELKSDPDGNAWLFAESGMFHCIRQQKKVDHIFETGGSKNDRSSAIVTTGAFNKYNDLWITNGHNGIQAIDRIDYSLLATHDVSDGLPSMQVSSINTDSTGRIWAGTSSGLGLFNPRNKTWRLFNRLDGLVNDYLDGNIFITANNKMIIDQLNGFLIKDINELAPGTDPPILHLTSIKINSKEYGDTMLPEFTRQLILPHDQNSIDIEFAAMDWIYPFKTFYYYYIEGIPSQSGMSVDNQDCKISLIDLQPGKYVLHIKALNGNGIFSKEIAFPITIKPPFWRTWWFISICILALALLLYSLYRYRINRIIEMQHVRNSISRDLHDEIGATLSSVNMLSAVALIKAGHENQASPIIQQIKDSVQRAGESMDDIVWSVNPANDLAVDTFARIRKYITELAEPKGVNCIIEIDEPGSTLKLPMELRRDTYLVCKEAVNNALKYSRCSEIRLDIHLSGGQLIIKVADNGSGFDPAVLQQTTRNGISNMRHRVEKHKGIFEIRSENGKGTTVSCRIPL